MALNCSNCRTMIQNASPMVRKNTWDKARDHGFQLFRYYICLRKRAVQVIYFFIYVIHFFYLFFNYFIFYKHFFFYLFFFKNLSLSSRLSSSKPKTTHFTYKMGCFWLTSWYELLGKRTCIKLYCTVFVYVPTMIRSCIKMHDLIMETYHFCYVHVMFDDVLSIFNDLLLNFNDFLLIFNDFRLTFDDFLDFQ